MKARRSKQPNAMSHIKMQRRRNQVAKLMAIRRGDSPPKRSAAYVSALAFLQRRSRFMMVLIYVVAALLAYRAAFVVLSPSYRMRSALVTANLSPVSLGRLMDQAGVLNRLASNIEHTTISELRGALDVMVNLTERSSRELQAQYDAWSIVRGQIKNDGTTYNELRARLEQTQRLQETEILRLREALDRAQKPSTWTDVGNIGLSFLFGVLSSILATFIWEKRSSAGRWWQSQAEVRFPAD